MPAFDLTPGLIRMAADSDRAMRAIATKLPQIASLDAHTGRIDLNAGALRGAVTGAAPGAAGQRFADWVVFHAGGGVLALDSRGGTHPYIPWLALEDLVVGLGGCPPALRRQLGVDAGTDGVAAREILRARFPVLPADVFAPGPAALLGRNPVARLGRDAGGAGGGPDPDPSRPSRTRPPGGGSWTPGTPSSQQPDIPATLACLKNGTYTDIGGGSGWMWLLGFRVCLDNSCAQIVGNTLMSLGAPGWTDLLEGLWELITSGIEALFASMLVWVYWLIIMTKATLAGWILGSDKGNGICICVPWSQLPPCWVVSR